MGIIPLYSMYRLNRNMYSKRSMYTVQYNEGTRRMNTIELHKKIVVIIMIIVIINIIIIIIKISIFVICQQTEIDCQM